MSGNRRRYGSFGDFYPWYLSEHQNRVCRRLHFLGTGLVIVAVATIAWAGTWAGLVVVPIVGYVPAWAGHFFFERNRPATFRHPFYSLAGDFVMFWQILTGRLPV